MPTKEQTNELSFEHESILCVTLKPKSTSRSAYFSFQLHDPALEFTMNESDTLLQFVQKLEGFFTQPSQQPSSDVDSTEQPNVIQDIRFVLKNSYILSLNMPQSKVWSLAEADDLNIIVNATKLFRVDYGNIYNRFGNDAFHEQNYKEAIKHYTTSFTRYPNHLKPLANRALCCFREGIPEQCVTDLELFFAKYHEFEKVNKISTSDQPLYNKSLFRRGRAYFQLAHEVATGKRSTASIAQSLNWDAMEDEDDKIKISIRLFRLCLLDFSKLGDEEFAKNNTASVEFDSAWRYIFDHDDININPLPACPLCRSTNISQPPSDFFPADVHIVPSNISSYHQQTPTSERVYICTSCTTKMQEKETQFFEKAYKPMLERSEREQREKSFVIKDARGWLSTFMDYLALKPLFTKAEPGSNLALPNFGELIGNEKVYAALAKMRRSAIQKPNAANKATPPKQYMLVEDKDAVIKQKQNNQQLKWAINQVHDKLSASTINYFHTQLGVFHFFTTIVSPSSTFSGAISGSVDEGLGYDLTNHQITTTAEKVEISPSRHLPSTISSLIRNSNK
jgi:hypothetical protein